MSYRIFILACLAFGLTLVVGLPAVHALDLSSVQRLNDPSAIMKDLVNCRSDMKVCWTLQGTKRVITVDKRERFVSATNLTITGTLFASHLFDSASTFANVGKVRVTKTLFPDGSMLIETTEIREKNFIVRPTLADPKKFHLIWGGFHAGVAIASWKLRRANTRTFWGKMARGAGFVLPVGLTAAHMWLWHRNNEGARGYSWPVLETALGP